MASNSKRARLQLHVWERESISYCKCSALSYTHTHCPCNKCEGRAVSRATEYRHWKSALDTVGIFNDSQDSSDFENGDDGGDGGSGDRSTGDGGDGGDGTEEVNATAVAGSGDGDDNGCDNGDSDDNSDKGDHIDPIKLDVIEAVINAMKLTEEVNGSQQSFMNILNYGKELYYKGKGNRFDTEKVWPKSWQSAVCLLQSNGYKNPKDLFICLNSCHPCSFDIFESSSEKCRFCNEVASNCIKYSYLPLRDKILRWCSNEDFCKKMTKHWTERDHWLGVVGGYAIKKEIWDGSRFSELSWFWDPSSKWILPTFCPHCRSVLSAAQIEKELPDNYCIDDIDDNNVTVTLECEQCFNKLDHYVTTAIGDPRNIALIGHWDGWQPFSTAQHSSGAIEVSIVTMSKKDRSKTDEVYVCGFVPCYQLPNKRPNSLDPFLLPLIEEIEELFINGVTVNYAAEIAGIPPGECQIRCLILLWTGDYPAQSEVGKIINGGIHPCRRCDLKGEKHPTTTHYYYSDYRYRSRNPWPQRNLGQCLEDMNRVDSEERVSVRTSMSRECGFTGLSILHRLYPLYGFDTLNDLVFDAMHNVPMNVASNHLHYYLNEGIVTAQQLEDGLKLIEWTPELKSGRVPTSVTQRLGYWKAEELQKFTYPASEYILGGLIPDEHYHAWIEIVRITEMFYKTGRNGWTSQDCKLFKNLILRHNILTEEAEGLKSCVVTLHNLIHFPDDIQRFSSPDNYWCYVFERAVKHYVERSHNSKNLEHTFARAESRREFLKFYMSTSTPLISTSMIDNSDLVHASSLQKAMKVSEDFPNIVSVLVGGKHYQALSKTDIQRTYGLVNFNQPPPDQAGGVFVRSVFMTKHSCNGMLYRIGEYCMVTNPQGSGRAIVKICDVFSFNVDQVYHNFIQGYLYAQDDEDPLTHPHSGNPIVKYAQVTVTCLASHIVRKVMLFPHQTLNDHFIVIDYDRERVPLSPEDVIVPVYLEKGDMVTVRGDSDELWLAHIQVVNREAKTCNVYFYVPSESDDSKYHKEVGGRLERVHWDSIIGISTGRWLSSSLYCRESC